MNRQQFSTARAQRVSWYMYDWANSAFSTSVLTVFLGPFVTSVAESTVAPGQTISFLGYRIPPGSVFPFWIGFSLFCRFLALPCLGWFTDRAASNKQMLGLWAYVGAVSTIAMYWVKDGRLALAAILTVLANFSFGASVVFYNSLLPKLIPADKREDASCLGWALGCLGGGMLLAAHLGLLLNATKWGLETQQAVRLILASSGVWWALFTLWPMLIIGTGSKDSRSNILSRPFAARRPSAAEAFRKLQSHPIALKLIGANIVYEVGIQTVMVTFALFGRQELKVSFETLATAILMVQFVGIFGAFAFGYLTRRVGAQKAVLIALAGWVAVLIYAFGWASTELDFFIMAAGGGFSIGGTGALSRVLLADVIPSGSTAEFFGLREAGISGTGWVGPIFFGLALQVTGSYRIAILSLVVFFVAGAVVLATIKVPKTNQASTVSAWSTQSPPA